MSNYQRLLIERTQVADGAIYSAKLGLGIQSGTGTPPVGGAYVTFSTAYGTPPEVFLGPGTGPIAAATAMGSGVHPILVRVTSGSFKWKGTPVKRAFWRAVGFLDSQGN